MAVISTSSVFRQEIYQFTTSALANAIKLKLLRCSNDLDFTEYTVKCPLLYVINAPLVIPISVGSPSQENTRGPNMAVDERGSTAQCA